jgi:glucose-6-phosphate 1-dehydrogenase
MIKYFLFIITLLSYFHIVNATENTVIEDQVLVIFGGTGDLAKHKLIPALVRLAKNEQLPKDFACVCIGRSNYTEEEYRTQLSNIVHSTDWELLKDHIHYFKADINNDEDYNRLQNYLLQFSKNKIFYLSVAANYFSIIIERLAQHELLNSSRVIIEKPFGYDTDSAIELQKNITQYLDESQIYRIDHYLGKEVVQNILSFRMQNPQFESQWNSEYIKAVTITLSEDIGIGTRGVFFEQTGALRDLVQNHMMQLVTLVGMELPASLKDDPLPNKLKFLEAIQPITSGEQNLNVIRGQYGPGLINQKPVLGYREEENVAVDSNVETFVAAKLFVDNARWKNVPFNLIAGKRMAQRHAEIVLSFQDYSLVFRVQPEKEIYLLSESKTLLESFNDKNSYDAYEKLIHDCMKGERNNFTSFDELLLSWKLWSPVLKNWSLETNTNFPNYSAGENGPSETIDWR